jgi:hypothetical protein
MQGQVCTWPLATFKSCCKVQVTHPFLFVAYFGGQQRVLCVVHGHPTVFQDLAGKRCGWRGVRLSGVTAWPSPSCPALAPAHDCYLSAFTQAARAGTGSCMPGP